MNLYLSIAWGVLYLLCAALGIFSVPEWVGICVCLLFFVPPAVILFRAHREKNSKPIRLIRNLSIAWLAVTVILLILNILSVSMSETAGNILYYTMVVLTAPMVCGRYWLIALFLWACLLAVSLQECKNRKK